MKSDGYVTKRAVYLILAYRLDGTKELLGIWFADTESKHEWMSIFDEIKKRGVQSIFSSQWMELVDLKQALKPYSSSTLHRTFNS